MSELLHVPVLLAEVVELLKPEPGKLLLDGTAGAGGHAFALADAGATVIALDRDPLAVDLARQRLAPFGERCRVVRRNFAAAREVLDELGIDSVDGTLLDLGVSSMQLDLPERGFGFRAEGPLDMRMSSGEGPSARDLIASSDEITIAGVLRDLGEEHFAKPIARAIKRSARMETTLDLALAVEAAVPRSRWPKGIHVATRTFQGIRLWVNRELESLESFLNDLPLLLGVGARAAIISFHSLEDRAVKHRFRELAGACSCPPRLPVCVCGAGGRYAVLTKRPVIAGDAEVGLNRRSRSAKLRGVERLQTSRAAA